MTVKELRKALKKMSDTSFKKDFIPNYGGHVAEREGIVEQFAHDRKHEGRLCYLLNLPTEQEKSVQCAVYAAWASIVSALIALVSVVAVFWRLAT